MTPSVSIVMPVRDGAAFLPVALDSLLTQSFCDFEVLAIDDGSRDATPEILAAAARRDPRVRTLRTAALGLVPALNRGLAEARAPLIARMDADDVAAPERLALQVAALDRDPSLALVAGAWRVVDAAGRVRRTVNPPVDPARLRAELARRNPIAHGSVMMRRDAALAVGGYRAAFRLAEDYDLWLRLSERFGLAALPDVLLDYREHAGQSSLSDLEQRLIADQGARAASRLRRTGQPDGCDGARPLRAADLLRLALHPDDVQAELLAGALGAAEDAATAGHRRAGQAALDLAWRQRPSRLRTRLHLHWLAARLRWSGTA